MRKRYVFFIAGAILGSSILFLINLPNVEEPRRDLSYIIYFASPGRDNILPEWRFLNTEINAGNILENLPIIIEELRNPSGGNLSILPDNLNIIGAYFYENTLSLNFSSEYNEMPPYREILARVGLVYTFTTGYIDNIRIYVVGEELKDSGGAVMGNLNRNNTKLNPHITHGETVPAFRLITFYYVLPDLQGLGMERMSIDTSADVPLEEQVLIDLFEMGRLFIHPETRIINVSVIENIAYVDLSYHFDTRPGLGENAQRLTIYAIVNTLADLSDPNITIDEVQFLVEGQRLSEYEGYVDLGSSFFKNEDVYIHTPEE